MFFFFQNLKYETFDRYDLLLGFILEYGLRAIQQ